MSDEEQTSITIETDEFYFRLKKWTPLTRLFVNRIADCLNKEAEEQEPVEKEKEPIKPDLDKIEYGETKKPDYKEKPDGTKVTGATTLMDKKHLVKKYGTASIWQPIVDFILGNTPDDFVIEDVKEQVAKFYKDNLKKELKSSSVRTYGDYYIRHMEEEGLIERYADLPIATYRKTKPEKKPEEKVPTEKPPEKPSGEVPTEKPPPLEVEKPEKKVELSAVATAIYDLATKERWMQIGAIATVESVEERLKDFSSDEIRSGLAELIRARLVRQDAPGKVKFR